MTFDSISQIWSMMIIEWNVMHNNHYNAWSMKCMISELRVWSQNTGMYDVSSQIYNETIIMSKLDIRYEVKLLICMILVVWSMMKQQYLTYEVKSLICMISVVWCMMKWNLDQGLPDIYSIIKSLTTFISNYVISMISVYLNLILINWND